MPGNGDSDSSSFSESIPLGSLSSGRSVHSSVQLATSIPRPSDRQNSNQEGHGDDRLADVDPTPPPLGVKLTVYRLVVMTTVLSFGTARSILTYKDQSIAPTTLGWVSWVSGTFLTVVLYWFGLYEDSNKWKWFFQFDLAPAIGYCAMRAVAECIWLLFYDGWPVFALLVNLLNWLIAYVYACYFPRVRLPSSAGIAAGFSVWICGQLIWLVVCRTARPILDRGRKCVKGFVDIYAPGARRAERYGWFGAGNRVRYFCGTALTYLPFVVYFMIVPDRIRALVKPTV